MNTWLKVIIALLLVFSPGAVGADASPTAVQAVNFTNFLSNVQSISAGNAIQVFASHNGWAEVTTAAYGPGENAYCPAGRLFFGAGNRIAATDLNGQLVTLPGNAPNPWVANFSETYPPYIIYDNQLVKLKTGELVYTFEGVTWNNSVAPHPEWWNFFTTYPLKGQTYPGGRGIIYVFRSADCGANWIHVSDIDAAKLDVPTTLASTSEPDAVDNVGLCGYPRRKHNAGGEYSEAGGWDGHYLYADPYTGYLFLSTICIYGTQVVNEEFYRALIVTSHDKGNNWTVIALSGEQPQMWLWRTPLSSNNASKIGYAFEDGTSQTKMVVFDATAMSVDLSTAKKVATFTGGNLPAAIQTDTAGMTTFPTLVGDNLNPARFYLAQPTIQASGELDFHFYNTDGSTSYQTGDTLRPVTTGGSTFHGTLIDPQPNSTLSVFYWTDVSPTSPNRYHERFQVFSHGEPLLSAPGELTLANNLSYYYAYESGQFMGDYYSGATYIDSNGNTAFVCPWNQNGGLYFNTITITPPVERAWAAGWNADGYYKQDSEMNAVNKSVIALNNFLLSNGQLHYNTVWARTPNTNNTWVGIFQGADLLSKDTDMQSQGFKMIDVSAIVFPGDAVRFNAVWTKTSDNYTWFAGWATADLGTKISQLSTQGYNVLKLSSYVDSQNHAFYNAILEKISGTYTWAAGFTSGDLISQDTTLRAQGYRMIDISAMVMAGDQVRYNAVWKKTAVPGNFIGGWNTADFANKNEAMLKQGYCIVQLNAFVLSGDQVRYNAIWEPIYKIYLPLLRR